MCTQQKRFIFLLTFLFLFAIVNLYSVTFMIMLLRALFLCTLFFDDCVNKTVSAINTFEIIITMNQKIDVEKGSSESQEVKS